MEEKEGSDNHRKWKENQQQQREWARPQQLCRLDFKVATEWVFKTLVTQRTMERKLPKMADSSAGSQRPRAPIVSKNLFSLWRSQGRKGSGRVSLTFSADADSKYNWRSLLAILEVMYIIFIKKSIPQLNLSKIVQFHKGVGHSPYFLFFTNI